MPSGTTRPSLCPSCRKLVGIGETRCPTCGASLTFSPTALASSLKAFLPSEYPVTALILGMNVLVFLVSTVVGAGQEGAVAAFMTGSRLVSMIGGVWAPAILHGEVWRLVTPIFLHGGLLHILFNSMALADLGPPVEHTYGSARFLFLYVITGILGFCGTVAWSVLTGPHLSIGGSGAVLGIVGVLLAITKRRSGIQMEMLRAQLLRSLGYIFLMGVFWRFDNAAHVAGLAAGFGLGMLMTDRPPANVAQRNVAAILGGVSGLIVVAAFAAMLLSAFVA